MGTIAVLGVVASAVAGAVYVMRSDKKKGKTSCGYGCNGCPNKDLCHKQKNIE